MKDLVIEAKSEGYTVSTDPGRLDLPAIHRFLSTSYWSPDLPFDVLRRAIAGSLCFGLYHAQAPKQAEPFGGFDCQ